MHSTFDNILLLGRPASGKSEFIDFMKHLPAAERAAQYHVGAFEEMDDFPWIWEKFMEDNLWEAAGYPRRYSSGGDNPGMMPEGGPLFDFCLQKFNQEFERRLTAQPEFFPQSTLFIEFARGGQNAYQRALAALSPAILQRACILFVLVSYPESCRRNDARYQAQLKHSVLAHKVPDATMAAFYQTHDWLELTHQQPQGYLPVNGVRVPYVTVDNEIEPRTPAAYAARYGDPLRKLMGLRNGTV